MMKLLLSISFALAAGYASANPFDENVSIARECGIEGDHACAFEMLMAAAEDFDMPLAEAETSLEFLTGAMLENALIQGSEKWDADVSRDAAERYIAHLNSAYPNVDVFYATGHTVRAAACTELNESTCVTDSISFLCDNKSRLIAPLSGHPSAQSFVTQTVAFMSGC